MTSTFITPQKIIVIWLSLLALVIAGCLVGLPQVSQTEKNALIISLTAASASVATVPFFLIGLRHFEHSARRAFILVCAGMVMYGVGTIQFPVINIVGGEDFWVGSGAALVPFVLTVSFQYFGIRRFGRLMLIRSHWFTWPLAYACACIAAVAVAVTPGSKPIMIAQIWLLTIISFTVLATTVIRARIAGRYRPAISWLLAGNIMAAASALYQIILSLLRLPDDHWYMASGVSAWPFVVTGLLMVRTGYEFARIEANLSAPITKSASPIEVVLYAASLASNPHAVDRPLDRLRMITSKTDYNPGVPLSQQEEIALAETYKEIETYLAQSDPVLRFDVAVLRESIRTRFNAPASTASSFWQLFLAPAAPITDNTPKL